jgi:hypothetical protein
VNSYLARLMRQSAITIARPDSGPALQSSVVATDPVAPMADIVEEETAREAPVFRAPVTAVDRERNPESAAVAPQLRSEKAAEGESYAAAPLLQEVPRQMQSFEARDRPAADAIPFVSIAAATVSPSPNEQMPAGETHPVVSAGIEEIPNRTPSAEEIVHEVIAWVTEPQSLATRLAPQNHALPANHAARANQAAPTNHASPANHAPQTGPVVEAISASDARLLPKRSDARAFSVDDLAKGDFPERNERDLFAPTDAHSSKRPPSNPEPWSVQIDSIHLTIEEPAVKSVPPPVAPRVAPTAVARSSQFTPSQLRRHYLRPF